MKVLTFLHSFEPGGVERVALRLVGAGGRWASRRRYSLVAPTAHCAAKSLAISTSRRRASPGWGQRGAKRPG